MLQKINYLRSILDKELETKDPTHKEILRLSQLLDDLIAEYYGLKTHDENGETVGDNIGD